MTVARVDAVADDEVIGESVLHAAFAVGTPVGFGVAFFNGAVVGDDGFPIGTFDADACGLGTDGVEGVVVGGGLSGNDEFLPDFNEVAFEFIGVFESVNGGAVALRNAAEGIAALDGVDAGTVGKCLRSKSRTYRCGK